MAAVNPKLFLSYAWADDQPFVERLYTDLSSRGYEPWMDKKNMPSRGRSLPVEVISEINECDRVIAVIGPAALTSEACRAEREYASSTGKLITAILHLGDYKSLPPQLSQYFVPDFRESRPYEAAIDELLRVLAEPPVPPGPLFDVPTLPAHLQHRPNDLSALCEALTAKELKPVAIISPGNVALQGMGGVGKTVLATLAAKDYRIRRAFKDGIIWLSLGQHPDLLGELRNAGAALREDLAEWTSETLARMRLSEALKNKECLLILDDVWNTPDTEPFFRALSPSCALLLTTRNLEVVKTIGAKAHQLDVFTEEQALELLAKWSGQPTNSLPADARHVAQECGYLPLALAMIGAMVGKDSRRWANALHKLRSADLEKIRQQFPGYPYPDLMRAIDVSVESLDGTTRERYLDFAVFPKATAVPEAALETLWAPLALDKWDVQDTTDRFIALSLGQRDDEGRVTLHDLQWDYARRKTGDVKVVALHERLVAAYRQKSPDGWHKSTNDGYLFEQLCHHLEAAGDREEVKRLLCDVRWLEAQLRAAGIASLLADFRLVSDSDDLSSIRAAIELSAHITTREPSELRGQLYGRLLSHDTAQVGLLRKIIDEDREAIWLRLLTPSIRAPGGALLRSFMGHTDRVYSMALTPDGHRAITASFDGSLKIWQVESCAEMGSLVGHEGWVLSVAATPDGKRAISGSSDGTIRIWDLNTKSVVAVLQGQCGALHAIAVTPNGHHAVSGSEDGRLRVWNLDTLALERTLEGHSDWIRSVALSLDGRLIISGSDDATVRVWDFETGENTRILKGHKHFVLSVAVAHNERYAISGSNDRHIIVWDMERGTEVRRFGGPSPVLAVATTRDERYIVSGHWDGTVRVWDSDRGIQQSVFRGHTGAVTTIRLTPDGRYVFSSSEDHTVRIWDVTRASEPTVQQHSDSVNEIIITPEGRRALSASRDHTIKVWDARSGIEERTLTHQDSLSSVAVTADSSRVLSVCGDESVRVWDIDRGSEEFSMHCSGTDNFIDVTRDGLSAVSSSSNTGTMTVWDLETGTQRYTVAAHDRQVMSTAITPDGKKAVTLGTDTCIKVWDLMTGTLLATLPGQHSSFSLGVSQDGRRVISVADDGKLRMWNLSSYAEELTINNIGLVYKLALTPDCRLVAAGGRDGTIRVWDLETGSERFVLKGHRDSINDLLITPDGRYVISTSWDFSMRLWSLVDGDQLASFTGESSLNKIAWAPLERTIVTAETSGRVHFLHIEHIDVGPSIVTAFRAEGGTYGLRCAFCGHWFELKSVLSAVICTMCRGCMQLNKFTIEADWKRFASAATTLHAGTSLAMPRPAIPERHVQLIYEGRAKETPGKSWITFGPSHNQGERDRGRLARHLASVSSGLASVAHPLANPERASQLNRKYIEEMKVWQQLPLWKRIRTKRPQRPTGI